MIKVIEKDDSRMGQYIDLINAMVRAREFMAQTVRRLEQSEISMPFV